MRNIRGIPTAKDLYGRFYNRQKKINTGQRDRYYIMNSHTAIITAEAFDNVQEEMSRRARLIRKEDGIVGSSISKYNGKYLLGNLLVCGDCGASYRRRTERGKVVWRCVTRIEKGKITAKEYNHVKEEQMRTIGITYNLQLQIC